MCWIKLNKGTLININRMFPKAELNIHITI